MKKIFSFLFALLLTVALLTSCDLFERHKHEFESYLVKAPTCRETGLVERLCKTCGEKEYEHLMKSGHRYSNGICTGCGLFGSPEDEITPIPMPSGANNQAAWTMSKIHENVLKFGFDVPYQDFINTLGEGTISNPYFDSLGILHFSVHTFLDTDDVVDVPVALVVGRVSPESGSSLPTVRQAEISNGSLLIQYTNGVQVSVGSFQAQSATPYITGFGINTQNELIAYYSNNTLAFLGTVSTGEAPSSDTTNIVYRKEGNGYTIRSVNVTDTILSIPLSHLGNPIIRIEKDAFKSLNNSVLTLVIPEGVALESGALSALTHEEELILRRMYICPQRGSVNMLCNELGVEQSSIYRKRDAALYHFTIALYGIS